MDRCALFVDAGYVLADGAMAVHGTRRRESVTWDYPGLINLLANLAMERSRLPLLRCYWYDSTVEGRRSRDHDELADLPGVKLRLAKMRPGHREGVEGEIHRDLTTLARNKAVSDAMVVSADEDLAQVIADVQDMGMRVTLLHIATDAVSEIPRALRQECDDIVEINVMQLRPYAELISGAEPPRQSEREGGMLALRAGSNGNGNGNGYGNGNASAGRDTRMTGQTAAQAPPLAAAQLAPPPSAPPAPLPTPLLAPPAAEQQEFSQQEFGQTDRADGAPEYAPLGEYATVADYGSVADYRPFADYGVGPDYGPSLPDFAPPVLSAPPAPPAPPASLAPPAPPAPSVPDFESRTAGGRPEFGARVEMPVRQDSQSRTELPEYAELPTRDRVYASPLAAPSPIAAAATSGAAQVRRLPTRHGGQPGHTASQPSFEPSSFGQPSLGESSPGESPLGEPSPSMQGLAISAGTDPGGGSSGSGGQPIAPVLPMEQAGQGYGGNRGGGYGGYRPANGPVSPVAPASPVSLVGQPSGPSGPSIQADPSGQGNGSGGQHSQGNQNAQNGQHGQQESSGYPALSQVVATPQGARQDAGAGGSAGYSGGQSGASLADAVQSAHEEGQAFGESVARDAPALWLEAVLARKPRMPSDLEARLLQGSALPIDFLLHDEVRHALRRGFWDALERARR